MYRKTENAQVNQSLRKLVAGLFEAMETKEYDKITVAEVCRNARVTRRTFYLNCKSKEDLICYASDRLMDEMVKRCDPDDDPGEQCYQFLAFWRDHQDFLKKIYDGGLFPIFRDALMRYCDEVLQPRIDEKFPGYVKQTPKQKHLSNAFFVGGLGLLLYEWTEDGFTLTPDELLRAIPQFVAGAKMRR